MTYQPVLYRAHDGNDYTDIGVYQKAGGYQAARRAVRMKPADVEAQVKASGLRGRGGAGFATGVKWSFVPRNTGKPIYLVVNADEGEPGTFKDRYFLRHDPHRIIEGCIICARAVGIDTAYVYVRGEFAYEIEVLQKAIAAATNAGFLGKGRGLPLPEGGRFGLEIVVHAGAGAYVCGEETGLLESIEGKPGQPRVKPPFPAVVGLFGCPTVINNVETLCALPLIFEEGKGADWFAALGTPKSSGPKIYGVSGHVKRPGLYEAPMGLNLRTLIFDLCGGTLDDRPLKCVIPGGSSTPCLLPDEIDVPLSFEHLAERKTMLGTGCAMVVAEPTCIVELARRTARFYAHESCGQCTPCRQGCGWLERLITRIERGLGEPGDLDLILSICDQISGNTICALGDACEMPIRGFVTKFRAEFEEHIRLGRCPYRQ